MEVRVTKKGFEAKLGNLNELIDVSEGTAKELFEKGLAESKYAVKNRLRLRKKMR
jgi:hypothetical protein